MKKREEKPKRNLKKGLTKPKTRHQRSVKKRKRDLKSEQKKEGRGKIVRKKDKKGQSVAAGLSRYLMDKAFPVLTNEITKKVSKEGAKGQK